MIISRHRPGGRVSSTGMECLVKRPGWDLGWDLGREWHAPQALVESHQVVVDQH